jgi:hypothetical protein
MAESIKEDHLTLLGVLPVNTVKIKAPGDYVFGAFLYEKSYGNSDLSAAETSSPDT